MFHTSPHRGRYTCYGKSLYFVWEKPFPWRLLDRHWKPFSPLGNQSLGVQLLWFQVSVKSIRGRGGWGVKKERMTSAIWEARSLQKGQGRTHWGWARPWCCILMVTTVSSSKCLPSFTHSFNTSWTDCINNTMLRVSHPLKIYQLFKQNTKTNYWARSVRSKHLTRHSIFNSEFKALIFPPS